jgi:hypothetical protein
MRAESADDLKPKSDTDLTEMGLAFRGVQIAEAFRGRLPARKELLDLTQELGVELTTSVFLKTAHEANGHGAFAKEVRGFDFDTDTAGDVRRLASKFELIFIPSNLPMSGRKWGDHIDPWRGWARAVGFKTDDIVTDPQATVSANARAILEYFKKNPAKDSSKNRLVVTYGQGASELRLLLHRAWGERGPGVRDFKRDELSCLRGWINVCGSYGGSSWSRHLSSSLLRWWPAAAKLKMQGRNPLVLKETSNDFSMWKSPVKFPEGFLTVNIVGVPLRSQVPAGLYQSYLEIAKRFPNDGLVSVSEAIVPGGLVLPIAGMSHRAEDVKLEPVFRRLLGVLAQTLKPQEREFELQISS